MGKRGPFQTMKGRSETSSNDRRKIRNPMSWKTKLVRYNQIEDALVLEARRRIWAQILVYGLQSGPLGPRYQIPDLRELVRVKLVECF